MVKVHPIIVIAAVFGSVASVGWAADHREAPRVRELPTVDLNDLYVFRSPERNRNLVFVLSVNPVSDPSFANTYAFSSRHLYRFTIDTNGDAVPENEIAVSFSPVSANGQTATITLPDGTTIEGDATQPTVQPDGPNPPVVITDPAAPGVRGFAGPREDPFYFDGVGFNRFLAGGSFTNMDGFAGLNVSAIVIEIPINQVNNGSRRLQVSAFTNFRADDGSAGLNVDRTGNPAVSTVLIPLGQRDRFNRGLPENDAEDFGPVIVQSLNDFGTPQDNIDVLASVAVPDTLKINLNQPVGFPNGRALGDDVIDILLALILDDETASDGVDSNDVAFLDEFPYLAPPQQVP